VHEIERVVAGFEAEPEGEVRLSAPPGLADHFVAPLLPALHARHPQLRIDLDASVTYSDLTRREADLALRTTRPERGELIARRLLDSPDVPLASPATVERLGRLRAWGDTPWVNWGPALAHLPSAQWLSAHVPDAAVVLRSNSMGALIEAIRAGLGVALFPEAYARRSGLARVRVAPKLLAASAPFPDNTLWLVGHRALRQVPRIDAVWRFLIEHASAGPQGTRPPSEGSPARPGRS